MKTKESAESKKQSVTLKDLKTRKNPKGGFGIINNTGPTSVPAGPGAVFVSVGGSNSRH